MLNGIRKKLIMIRESTVMALDNIRSNKIRSFLTLLGIMIGVMAVITLISTVSGVSGTISSSFSSMGVGTLTVNVSGSDLKTGMTPEDLGVISALENVDGVVPSVRLNGRVSYGRDVQTGISVSGRTARRPGRASPASNSKVTTPRSGRSSSPSSPYFSGCSSRR